jgi:hypothetical protein
MIFKKGKRYILRNGMLAKCVGHPKMENGKELIEMKILEIDKIARYDIFGNIHDPKEILVPRNSRKYWEIVSELANAKDLYYERKD